MNKNVKGHRCQICGRNFALKASLGIHSLSHKESGINQVRFDEITPVVNARNEFVVRESDIDWRSLESEEPAKLRKPHQCSICGKHFALKMCLKTHIVKCKIEDSSPVVSKADATVLSRSNSVPITQSTGGADVESGVILSSSKETILEIPFHSPEGYPLDDNSNSEIVSANHQHSTSTSSEKFTSISLGSLESHSNPDVVVITGTGIEERLVNVIVLEEDNESVEFNTKHVYPMKSVTFFTEPEEVVGKCKVEPSNISDDADQLQQLGDWDKTKDVLTSSVKKLCIKKVGKKSKISQYKCAICKDNFDSKRVLQEHIELGNYCCSDCEETFPVCVLLKDHEVSHFKHHCPACEEAFFSEDVLDDHCNQRSYNCVFCKATFSLCSDAKIHVEAHDETCCRACKEMFVSKEALDDHREKKPYQCQFCEQSFESCAVSKRHQILHDNEQKRSKVSSKVNSRNPRRKCTGCSETFPSYKDLLFHHESNSKFHCSKCGKKMCSAESFDIHREQKSFNCLRCVETFISCEDLLVHKKSHKICFPCKQVFPTEESLVMHTAQDNHVCEVCDEIFPLCESLKFHMRTHALKCKFCLSSFLYLSSLHKHELRHSIEELRCEHCQRMFTTLTGLKDHVKRVHLPEEEILCTVCGKVLKGSVYRTHECLHNAGLEKLQCKECGISFLKKPRFLVHMRLHAGGVRYHCRFCKEGFIFKRNLIVHLRSHAGEKPFPCNYCDMKFTTKYNLDLHCGSHNTEDKPFQCHVCFREFRIALALNQHLRTHFPSEEQTHKTCKVCGKEFQYRNILSLHYLEHTKEERENVGVTKVTIKYKTKDKKPNKPKVVEKKYECKHCGKRFAVRAQAEGHENMHTGNKPFKCSLCEKAYFSRHTLQQHALSHGDHRPYKCSECEKSYYIKAQLDLHKRIHTGEKPFKCQVCTKAFQSKQRLERHTRIHTGERPYQCEICEKSFTQYSHAKSHILIHTGERPHQCEVCGAAFAHKGNLVQHRKTHLKNKGT